MTDLIPIRRELLERIKSTLSYNRESGEFTWVQNRYKSHIGKRAGSLCAKGYLRITLFGKKYAAHRLAWLFVYGDFPEDQIDHIDGNRTNNRISNLRTCTAGENRQNVLCSKNTGASFDRSRNKWEAKIMIGKKSIRLGRFENPQDAHAAYCRAKADIHTFNKTPRYTGHGAEQTA